MCYLIWILLADACAYEIKHHVDQREQNGLHIKQINKGSTLDVAVLQL